MSNHSKRRQSRLGRPTPKPTDLRREVAGEPGYSLSAVKRMLAEKRVQIITVDRIKGGLHYNVIVRGIPRTFKINAEGMEA